MINRGVLAGALLSLLSSSTMAQLSGYPSGLANNPVHFGNLTAKTISTLTGADPTGVTDSAPAFRAAMISNNVLIIPPGTYRFASTQTAPCCALDAPAVLVQSLSNFAIMGYGATIVVDNAIALSSAFQFDRDTNFEVLGLTIQGSRSGLSAGQENAGITLTSDVNFHISDIHFTTGFGGLGAPFAGDWLVNGSIDHIQMDGAGICFDFAFLLRMSIENVYAKGVNTNGASGAGQVGNKCLSVINDVPNAGTNNTGVSFTATDDVKISRIDASNFTTGAAISTGTHLVLSHNAWHDNPGLGGALGLGIYIYYINGGNSTSVGVPPSNITIDGDMVYSNGAAVAGYGIVFDPSAIANGDIIQNIVVSNSLIDNNASVGIETTSTSHISNVLVSNNEFSGASQTTNIGASINSLNSGVVGPLTTPASAAATCTAGRIAWDTGFIYICTAGNTWKRVAIATW